MNDEEINAASPEQCLDRVNGRVSGKGGIAPHLQYASQYWATHLELSLPVELSQICSPVADPLVTQFIQRPEFAYWLENAAFLPRDPIPDQILCAGRYFARLANKSMPVNQAEEKCDDANMDETMFCSDVNRFWMQNSVAVRKHPGSLYACLGCWVCQKFKLYLAWENVFRLQKLKYINLFSTYILPGPSKYPSIQRCASMAELVPQ